ncbi:restriction endonuclease subunit S [Rhizobium lentis]|uniref:restriction endonuclease subunit S n=1 Tax=Rhizobium lentis TaxID=1138194 RepID=UPI001C82A35B|nr:restriction endonuclease subunit S [Rhizobium lentis]MBX5152056.1 restriction endonuclease subunit S [Rhizobium lentis]
MTEPWPHVELIEVCESVVDCVNKTAPLAGEATPYRMLRTTNVRNGYVDTANCRFVTREVYEKWTRRQVPRRGDVILTREAPLGEVGMLRDDETVFLGQRLMSYRADPSKLDANFLLYSLMGPELQAQIRATGSGSTVEHMRVPDAERLKIRLPDLSTQRRIGEILASYDELFLNNQRRSVILEDMARRLFDEWFVRFRYPGHEAVSLVETELGMVPEGWQPRKLSWWADDIRDTIDPQQVAPLVAYVGLEHLPRRSTTLVEVGRAQDVTSSKLMFEAGDILFGKIRPYFHKVAHMPFSGVCSTDAICIRAAVPKHTALILGLVSSDSFVAHAVATSNGTKMPRADWKVLKNYPLPEPPEPLLSAYERSVVPMMRGATNLAAQNVRLRTARDLLLPKLISGEIDVSAAQETFAEAAE